MPVTAKDKHKKVLIISANGFEDAELLQPCQRLTDEGVTVDIASLEKGSITGKHGKTVVANLAVDEVEPDNYDLLLLPGGKAPGRLRENERVLDIARYFFSKNKPVAAICHGPQILISAGVMQGVTATATHSVADEMRESGVNFLDQEVVVDRNLITSRRPDDIPAFIREILAQLAQV